MKLDCYAVLGLSPAAEDVVIRAAYLALMRSYHPDKNGSAEAAARARTITEAYKTIGNPVRRAEYDASRFEYRFEVLHRDDEAEPPRRRWRKPVVHWPKLPAVQWPKLPMVQWSKAPVIGAFAASALAIVLAIIVLPVTQRIGTDTASPNSAASLPHGTRAAEMAPAIAARAMSEKRRPEPVASVSSMPVEASVSPMPTVPVSREKVLADRSEPVPATPDKPVLAKVEPAKPRRTAELAAPPPAARPAAPKPAPVDEKARVAALEGMSTSFFNQSIDHADEAKRSQLHQARDFFVNARNACRSDSCVGDAHANYIRDISRIMKNR